MFTKIELKSFRGDFASAVKDLEKRYGVKMELGTISYSEEEFHTKLSCTKLGASGEVEVVQSAKEFGWLKEYLGFKGNLGDTYRGAGGVIHTVYALDGKKPKYPVLTRTPDGKRYKASVASVNYSLATGKKVV